jgi:hypothetical protein
VLCYTLSSETTADYLLRSALPSSDTTTDFTVTDRETDKAVEELAIEQPTNRQHLERESDIVTDRVVDTAVSSLEQKRQSNRHSGSSYRVKAT